LSDVYIFTQSLPISIKIFTDSIIILSQTGPCEKIKKESKFSKDTLLLLEVKYCGVLRKLIVAHQMLESLDK